MRSTHCHVRGCKSSWLLQVRLLFFAACIWVHLLVVLLMGSQHADSANGRDHGRAVQHLQGTAWQVEMNMRGGKEGHAVRQVACSSKWGIRREHMALVSSRCDCTEQWRALSAVCCCVLIRLLHLAEASVYRQFKSKQGGSGNGALCTTHSSSRLAATTSHDMSHEVEQLAAGLDAEHANKLLVEGILGKGACGTVFQGKWRGLPVAIKTMLFSASEAGRARGVSSYQAAVQEAAMCLGLTHRNIVATYHFDVKPIESKQEPGQLLVLDVEQHTESPAATEFKL